MRIYKLLNKSKVLLLWAITGMCISLLLIFPKEIRNGASNGIFLCLQVLIPSLFLFMILAGFIVRSGLASRIPKFIVKIFGRLFGLPSACCSVIFLSLLGGYPVGAAIIDNLYKTGVLGNKESERMCMFCVCAGPGFLVTYIGAVMTRNLSLGYILLCSQIISLVISGIIARLTINPQSTPSTAKANIKEPIVIKDALVSSVSDAIRSCVRMCALVVIFSSLSEVFITLTKGNSALIWITALIEITNGIKIIAEGYPTALIAFVCGFGGLCVHFQIFDILRDIKFSKCNFFIFRILQGVLCALSTYILLKFYPITESVFSTVKNGHTTVYTTSVGCIILIATCLMFLICIREKKCE